jgi:hypothetical protein
MSRVTRGLLMLAFLVSIVAGTPASANTPSAHSPSFMPYRPTTYQCPAVHPTSLCVNPSLTIAAWRNEQVGGSSAPRQISD